MACTLGEVGFAPLALLARLVPLRRVAAYQRIALAAARAVVEASSVVGWAVVKLRVSSVVRMARLGRLPVELLARLPRRRPMSLAG